MMGLAHTEHLSQLRILPLSWKETIREDISAVDHMLLFNMTSNPTPVSLMKGQWVCIHSNIHYYQDKFPQARIGDLTFNQASKSEDEGSFVVQWTATGDGFSDGGSSFYEFCYNKSIVSLIVKKYRQPELCIPRT